LISPVKDEKGKISNFIAIKEDVTERKKADEAIRQSELMLKKNNDEYLTLNKELIDSNNRIKRINKELVAAREKAEESDKLKTAFLANLSHEIRTPMNSIIGISDILLRSNITNENMELFQILNSSCHQLLNVVNDMIDISRIETGQMDIHIGKTNINQAITQIHNIFIPQVVQKSVVVEVSFQLKQELAEFNTDAFKLNQILTNLLSNAIKFTEQGKIEIGYKIVDSFIEFYVRDTGIGIKPEYHEIIFKRFRQVEMDFTRKYGGTGLGLPICKALVEMLGGRIWVESEFGKGSTFHFTLPYDNQILSDHKVELDKKTDYDLSDLIVLIAEDEKTNFLVLNEFLKDAGVKVIHARDGIEAIDIFLDNTNIDIVLMDIKMPRMNGIEATQAIKAINNKIPVIAITAYALAGDRKKFLAAGCDDYISKPIMQTELLEKIQKLTRKQ
jgi:signal transduction histidine kinase/CheY-like chemotaxis protein